MALGWKEPPSATERMRLTSHLVNVNEFRGAPGRGNVRNPLWGECLASFRRPTYHPLLMPREL